MKRILCLLFSFSCIYSFAQEKDLQNIRVDIIYLASDYLEGRETGKKGEELAAQYITTRFKEIGLKPKGLDNTYHQVFDFNYTANPHATSGEEKRGRNIIGFIDNQAENTVVIGAHFDHIGRGAFGSRYLEGPIIHNGADDNASGVGALLYLAQQLKSSDAKNNNYLFMAFSGEEMGLIGSKYFVKNPTIDLSKVNYMLNMDMVGRLGEDKSFVINGAGTSPSWKETFPKIKSGGLKITTTDSGVGPSDHTSFYLEDLPALHFFTGSHEDYHKPSDDSEKVNFKGVQEIGDWMLELIEILDGQGKLAFTKTKDDNQRRGASFKVSLGIMPAYSYDGVGMLVEAVLDDKPAQKAGIEDGDVLIKIGDLDVKDIYDYMEGLSKFKKGDSTTLVVKRGEKEVKVEVTF